MSKQSFLSRRDFLKLAACAPAVALLPSFVTEKRFIPYSYWPGYSSWIGTSHLMEIGELVELKGHVYTVIDVEYRGHFYKHPSMLLDRPIETEIPYDQPIVSRGTYDSSSLPFMWVSDQAPSLILRSRPLGWNTSC